MSAPKTAVDEAIRAAQDQAEISARNQSYAAATELLKGSALSSDVLVDKWSAVSDGIFKKIYGDLREMTQREG